MKYILIILVSLFIFSSCGNQNTNKENDIKDPLEFLNKEIVLSPDDYKLYGQRAMVNLESGKIDPAFRDINKAIALNPKDAALYIILSDIYFVLGNKDNSISSLKKAIDLEPQNEIPLIKLAELYLLTQEYEKAQFYSDRAISINVNVAEPYYYKGIAFLESSDTNSAIINLKVASNLDTANFTANMQLGVLYYGKNDSISEIYLKKAISNQADSPGAHYYLGMLYQSQSKYDDALAIYSQMLNGGKSSKRAYYNSGYIYLVELNEYDKAEDMFIQAVSLDSNFIEAVYNLGRTYEAKKEYDLARKYYNWSMEILPNYPLAIQGLNRLDQM